MLTGSPPVHIRRIVSALLAALAVLTATPAARAQATRTWTGLAAPDNNWTTVANWDTAVPGTGDTAQFNSAGNANTSITLGGAARPINTILFNGTPAAYNLGVLSSGDAFNFDAAGAITASAGITAAQTINAAVLTNGALTVTNSVTNTGGLVGLTLAGNVTIGGGGTLTVNNSVANVTTVLGGNIGDVAGQPGFVVYTATAAGASNNNNFIINGTNTYTGPTTLTVNTGSAGSVQIGTDSPFGTGKVTINASGNAAQFQALNGPRTIANAIDLNNGMTYIGGGGNTFGFTFTGPINVISTTAGRTINASVSGISATFGASPNSSTLTLGNPAANGGDNVGKTLTLNAVVGATIVLNDVVQDPAPGGGTASGGVVPQGGGTVAFNGLNTYSGTTNLSSGTATTIQIGSSSNGPPGAFTAGPFGTGTLIANSTANSPMQAVGADRTVANSINLNTGFTINNAATPHNLTLTGSMLFTSTASRTASVNTPGQTVTFGTPGTTSAITLATTTALNLAFDASQNSTMVINDIIQDNPTPPATANTISYNSLNNNTPQGTVLITGANTYAGSTTISGQTATGTIVPQTTLIGVSSVGNPGSIISGPFGKGTLIFNGNSNGPPIVEPFGADRTVANAVTMTSGFFAANAPGTAFNLTLTGPITLGATSRVLTNNMVAGVALTLGSAATPSAVTLGNTLVIQSQTAVAGAGGGTTIINDAIGGTGGLTVQSGGTVQLTSPNTYSGTTSVTGGRLLVNNTTGSGTSGGAVNVTGSGAVGSGGTLGGGNATGTAGFIAGNVTISTTAANQGGTLSPGNSAGTLTTTGTSVMTWNPVGSYLFEHDASATGTAPIGGPNNDLVRGTGTSSLSLLNLTPSAPFTLNLSPLNTPASLPTNPVTYTIADFSASTNATPIVLPAGGITGTDLTPFFTFTGTFQNTSAPVVTLANGGNQITVSFTPVPEPAFVLAACGGLTGLAAWRRRRSFLPA
jgi:fibronectin-binding autotransporter adhesin